MNIAFKRHLRRPGPRLLVPLLLILGLSGCQALTERLCELNQCEPVSPERDSYYLDQDLLDELSTLERLNQEQRLQRYEMLQPPLEAPGCRADNVRAAMLYITLGSPPGEDLPALTTAMEHCITDGTSRISPGVARLLHSSLAQRAIDHGRIQELEQRVDREQSRNAELAEQLEALKAIERSLRQRGQSPTNTREE